MIGRPFLCWPLGDNEMYVAALSKMAGLDDLEACAPKGLVKLVGAEDQDGWGLTEELHDFDHWGNENAHVT